MLFIKNDYIFPALMHVSNIFDQVGNFYFKEFKCFKEERKWIRKKKKSYNV